MNLLMGDPVYDDKGNIVVRKFGIKNAIFILFIGYIGYSLMEDYKVKGKMRGGGRGETFVLAVIIALILWGLSQIP